MVSSLSTIPTPLKQRGRRLRSRRCVGIVLLVAGIVSHALFGFWWFVWLPVNRTQQLFDPIQTAILGSKTNNNTATNTRIVSPKPSFEIPLHKTSEYVRSDIAKILHVPTESRIEIHLQSNRRCINPFFQGRISGWSLSMIDFDEALVNNNNNNVVYGTYDVLQMPMSGKYYVEIIVLLCERYDHGITGLNLPLKSQCLINTAMENHRITARGDTAYIDIDIDVQRHQHYSLGSMPLTSRGRWLHKDFVAKERLERKNSTTTPMVPPQPVFTRYQPEECVISEKDFKRSKDTDYCRAFVDRKRFDAYTFRWKKGYEALNRDILVLPNDFPQTNPTKSSITLNESSAILGKTKLDATKERQQQNNVHVCFVGASHSRVLNNKCQSLLQRTHKKANQTEVLAPELECSFHEVKFPNNLTNEWIVSQLQHCTHAVVGLFQWPFSYAQELIDVWSFAHWKTQMMGVVKRLEGFARKNDTLLRRILLRSAHPNGLKWQISKCPPGDLRSLPNARTATTILHKIANHEIASSEEAKSKQTITSFVDTDFITNPVWDSPDDWSHYNLEAGSVEIKFLLSTILLEERSMDIEYR